MSLEMLLHSQFYKQRSPNLKKLGFNFDLPVEIEYLKIQSMLYSAYHIRYDSTIVIMKDLNIPSCKTIDTIFKIFDIEPRNLSSAATYSLLSGRSIPRTNIRFSKVYHTSWFGEIFYLRSSYEEEYAKILDSQKIKYFVEHIRIKYFDKDQNKYRVAVPDFFLPFTNTLVEVKADYWLDIDNMIKKKEAYLALGYKLDLYLDHKLVSNW